MSEAVWQDDLLDRSGEAKLLQDYLLRRLEEKASHGLTRSFVLNLDAQWGSGKTFFIQRLSLQLKQEKFIVAEINAWEDDYADDPLVAVLSALEAATNPYVKGSTRAKSILKSIKSSGVEIAVSIGKNAVSSLAKRYIGGAVEEIPEIIDQSSKKSSDNPGREIVDAVIDEVTDRASKKLIEQFNLTKGRISDFKNKLTELTRILGDKNTKHKQIFVLVDELDRCRPNYAISMLERIKHLFETDGLIFVLATDTSQLQHSIRAIYGSEFDSQRYLMRFFDRQYRFKETNRANLVKRRIESRIKHTQFVIPPTATRSEDNTFELYFLRVANGFLLTPRDIEKAIDLVGDFASAWKSKALIQAALLIPIVCAKIMYGSDLILLRDRNSEQLTKLERHLSWRTDEVYIHDGRRTDFRASEFFKILFDNIDINLPRAAERFGAGGSFPQQWAREQFSNEFQRVHNATFTPGRHYASVLYSYFELVESISHFSD